MGRIVFPSVAQDRGAGYWLRPGNSWAARRKFLRPDYSVDWRDGFESPEQRTSTRSVPISTLHRRNPADAFRFLILGDTGEGDRSQYGLLPLIRGLKPDFLIINGDLAYPAGNWNDFRAGFFEPYRNLNMPIWAVPGNHEYYSDDNGLLFFELFCTERFRARWEEYGLLHRCQPGTYWELRHERDRQPFIVIGVDTLKKANLDGRGIGHREDTNQHEWLRWRLGLADREGGRVMILFHIPALVGAKHAGSTNLKELHRIIAEHACVKLVVCGHEHNFQSYAPNVFEAYLRQQVGVHAIASKPAYFVSGGGGAYLAATDFGDGDYRGSVYPSREQWKDHASAGERVVNRLGFGKWALGKVVGWISQGAQVDGDAARYLSLLLVDVDRAGSAKVSPVYLDDLEALFNHLPEGLVVNVQDNIAPNESEVQRCVQDRLSLII